MKTCASRAASPGSAAGCRQRRPAARRPGDRRRDGAVRSNSDATRPRSTSSTSVDRAATLDSGQIDELADHLHEVAGLHLDLGDSVAHLGAGSRRRPPRPRGSSVSASRLTVVSGVRSSCDRLSMNSARMCCRRRSSETSSRISQASPVDDAAGADQQPAPVGVGAPDFAGRRTLIQGGRRRSTRPGCPGTPR